MAEKISVRPFKRGSIPKSSWSGVVPSATYLDVEIGCGVGLHPILYAKENPQRLLLAIEHTRAKFEKFSSRYSHHNLENLIPIHANGISIVTHHLEPLSVDRFFFLYPNPNPKKNDLNKRWYAMPFMKEVIDTLKNNGEIILATNESFYANEAKRYFQEVWKLELVKDEILREGDLRPRTHFEKKYLERGQSCFNLVFKKTLEKNNLALID